MPYAVTFSLHVFVLLFFSSVFQFFIIHLSLFLSFPLIPTHKTHCLLIHIFSFSYPVKPNPPEKVTVSVMEDKDWPFLRVSWEPPHKADTRSGWITLIYELRVKLEGEDDWEVCNSLLVQGGGLTIKMFVFQM